MKDLERERAADALRKVMDLPDGRPSQATLPVLRGSLGGAVVMNGLGQALATELAPRPDPKDSRARRRRRRGAPDLADHVFEWLTRRSGVYPGVENVMKAITESTRRVYVRAQVEMLAWLTWHKKFCHAYLPKGS